MNTVTATELRTKTTQIFETLLRGETISLIRRSKIVGKIHPQDTKATLFDAKKFLAAAKRLNLPYLSPKERERNYREHLMKKYGKSLSGR